MLGFIKSIWFWGTALVLAILMYIYGPDTISNYLQDFGVFGWAYILYRQDKHDTLLNAILDTTADD